MKLKVYISVVDKLINPQEHSMTVPEFVGQMSSIRIINQKTLQISYKGKKYILKD